MNILILLSVAMIMLSCNASDGPKTILELAVDKNKLSADVKTLTDISPPRNYTNTASLDKAADFIRNRFIELGYNPVDQKFKVHGHEYKNIIASYGKDTGPRFIVGTHYDVAGNQPGADDNASAVASLLELARLFKEHSPQLNFRIDFAAYTLEEPPFFKTKNMGSYVHAKSLYDEKIEVAGMVCLESIGYYTEKPGSQQYPNPIMKLAYPSKGNFIAVVGNFNSSKLVNHFHGKMKHAAIGVEKLKAPSLLVGVDFSDHYNFWLHEYQAIMITDTAFYRNPHYHQKTDTIDTLNFDKMQEVVKGIYWALTNFKYKEKKNKE